MTDFDIKLEALTLKIKSRLSDKRFEHTLGVCDMARLLAEHCLPDAKDEICFAAMLHDIAKELSTEEQLSIIRREHIELTAADTPPVFHSYVAPYIVTSEFPEFATPRILSAVEKHTVGDVEMSVFDEIIFLADYIEMGRTYKDCIETREFMLSSMVDGDIAGNVNALHKACVMSIDRTCKSLFEKGKPVNPKSLDAKKSLLSKIY